MISTIEAPVLFITEAKKADISAGYGQCVAEMVAAQRFNQGNVGSRSIIHGCVTNGTQWRFLRLVEDQVTLDLMDYPLPPVDTILGILAWIIHQDFGQISNPSARFVSDFVYKNTLSKSKNR